MYRTYDGPDKRRNICPLYPTGNRRQVSADSILLAINELIAVGIHRYRRNNVIERVRARF